PPDLFDIHSHEQYPHEPIGPGTRQSVFSFSEPPLHTNLTGQLDRVTTSQSDISLEDTEKNRRKDRNDRNKTTAKEVRELREIGVDTRRGRGISGIKNPKLGERLNV